MTQKAETTGQNTGLVEAFTEILAILRKVWHTVELYPPNSLPNDVQINSDMYNYSISVV